MSLNPCFLFAQYNSEAPSKRNLNLTEKLIENRLNQIRAIQIKKNTSSYRVDKKETLFKK